MKILLINISLRPDSSTLLPPLGLAYIATSIYNAGYELEVLDIDAYRYQDSEIENLLQQKDYDVVAMGCIVTGYKEVKKLAQMVKKYKKNVLVIAGNSVASSIPELLLKNTEVDIAVIGEGDITIVEVLKAIEKNEKLDLVKGICFKSNNGIILTSPRDVITNIDDIPFINWELFDVNIYLEKSKYHIHEPYPVPFEEIRVLPINTARGCAYQCTFCYHVFRGKKYRARSAESIAEEILQLKKKFHINYINLFDELTFYSKKQCAEVAETFITKEINIAWCASSRSNLFNGSDLELLKELKKAGCLGFGYSLESANKEILKAMNKNFTKEEFIEQTNVLRQAGLSTWTSIVIGYPQETEETIRETFDCCYEAEIYPSVGYLIPLPGTPMYDYAINTGAIKDEEAYLLNLGDRQDFRINLTKLDPQVIQDLVIKNLRRISEKLGLDLNEENLIKTGHYRHKKGK